MVARPSPEALDLVSTALGRALDEIIATGGPAHPTSLHRTRDGDRLVRYRAGTLGEALEEARLALRDPEVEHETWVLVWDGYLTAEEWRTDALYAHLEIIGDDTAHLFVWRYGLLEDESIGPLEPTTWLGEDGRFASPHRSHPLGAGESTRSAPHGEVLPRRRRWFRRR